MKTVKFLKVGNESIGFNLGGKCNVYVAVLGDKFGYLPNEDKPYMPIGGRKTLKMVVNLLIFK
jgi:hypothetical protein